MKSAVLTVVLATAGCSFDDSGVPGTLPEVDARPGTVDAARPDAPLADASLRPDAPAPDAAFVCPAGYTRSAVTGSSYRLVEASRAWATGEADCEDDSNGLTHLVVIDDAFELNEVSVLATVPEVWVGISDRVDEDEFLTVTGAPATFLPWGPGEPNDQIFGEDCAELNEEVFNDESCSDLLFYVCECDGEPADPDAF